MLCPVLFNVQDIFEHKCLQCAGQRIDLVVKVTLTLSVVSGVIMFACHVTRARDFNNSIKSIKITDERVSAHISPQVNVL